MDRFNLIKLIKPNKEFKQNGKNYSNLCKNNFRKLNFFLPAPCRVANSNITVNEVKSTHYAVSCC